MNLICCCALIVQEFDIEWTSIFVNDTASYTSDTVLHQCLWYIPAYTGHLHMRNVNQYYVFIMLHKISTSVNDVTLKCSTFWLYENCQSMIGIVNGQGHPQGLWICARVSGYLSLAVYRIVWDLIHLCFKNKIFSYSIAMDGKKIERTNS